MTANDADRCIAVIALRSPNAPREQTESARCMRRAVVGGLCRQHARLAEQEAR